MKDTRQNEITEMLEKERFVSTSLLAEKYQVSVETIRRDLEQLEKKGIARRIYGGAELNDGYTPPWPPFEVRSSSFREAKVAIGQKAVEFIPDSATIALDVGSTIGEFCDTLEQRENLIVICNDIQSASKLFHSGRHQVYMMGGFLTKVGSSSGAFLKELLSTISDIDVFVCSTDGLSPEGGLTTNGERINEMKRRYIKKAKRTILLADHSKFSQKGFYKMCDFSDIDLMVTDSAAPLEDVEAIRKKGIQVEVVEAD